MNFNFYVVVMSFFSDASRSDWSDRRLAAAVADVIAVPKAAPADSFVLHAPLELLARVGLLPYVRPDERHAARSRLAQLATVYEAAGAPVPGRPTADPRPLDELAAALVAAIAAGDLDDVDHLAYAFGTRATPSEMRHAIASPVVASLAAAAHASIFLYLFPRIAADGSITGALLRGPARELARYPELQLHWFEDPDDPVVGVSLGDALLDVPMLGVPGSDFIFPIMHQAEESGLATKLLSAFAAASDTARVRRELSRIAAWSMLQEPSDYAPYGWSHCLTMPQAVMGIAGDGVEPARATAVAATYVVGFRAALGQRALDPNWVPGVSDFRDLAEARRDRPRRRGRVRVALRRRGARRHRRRSRGLRVGASRCAPGEVHARLLRRGRDRSRVPPPLPRGRRVPVGLVGPTPRRAVRRLTPSTRVDATSDGRFTRA